MVRCKSEGQQRDGASGRGKGKGFWWKKLTHGDDLDSLLFEGLSGRFGNVAGDGSDLEGLGEDGVGENRADDGAALVARGAEDGENVGHSVV